MCAVQNAIRYSFAVKEMWKYCFSHAFLSSQSIQQRVKKLADLRSQKDDISKEDCRLQQILDEIAAAATNSADEEKERLTLEAEITELEKQESQLKSKLAGLKKYDFTAIENETKTAREATNRWTDNICSIKSWCKTKFGVEEEKLDQQFEIPDGLDYVE